jgi:hypothetical protein
MHTVLYIYAPLFKGNALQLAVEKRISLILVRGLWAHSCHPALPLSEFFTLSLRKLNHP